MKSAGWNAIRTPNSGSVVVERRRASRDGTAPRSPGPRAAARRWTPCRIGECPQQRLVAVGERQQVAEQQHRGARRRPRPRPAARGRGSTAPRSARASGNDQGGDRRRQDLAAAACRRRRWTCARGIRPARRPCFRHSAPTGARGGGSPTPRRRSAAASPPALTLPMRARLSSSPRCLAATWVRASTCCVAQPPQTPKCGQRGARREADGAQDCGDARAVELGLRFEQPRLDHARRRARPRRTRPCPRCARRRGRRRRAPRSHTSLKLHSRAAGIRASGACRGSCR